jgi:hypothetical protein
MTITILNVMGENNKHGTANAGGAYGDIYKGEF